MHLFTLNLFHFIIFEVKKLKKISKIKLHFNLRKLVFRNGQKAY